MSEHFNKTQLMRERGWIESQIRRRLGPPDDTVPNKYSEKHPVQLFRRSRVLKVESTPEFKAEHFKTEVRRARRTKLDPPETYFWANWRDPIKQGPLEPGC